jgi:RES domain-containing protein
VAVVYAAQSQSLAALEILVHLGSAELLLSGYIAFELRFPSALLARVDRRHLPPNWREYPVSRNVQAVGDAWVASGRSAILQLPSATVPLEHIFLLNPFHSDFAKIRIAKPVDFCFDPRLFR